MKKSKIVTIGLLAISIAACHKHRRSTHAPVADWNGGGSSYVSTDGGYNYYGSQPGLPMWFWFMMMNNNHGGYYYGSSVMYYNRQPGWGVYSHGYSPIMSSGGRSYGFHGASARGGFGSSGRAVGA